MKAKNFVWGLGLSVLAFLGLAAFAGPVQAVSVVIDNGESGYSATGTWGSSTLAGYYWNDEIAWADASGGQTATWSFAGLDNGTYYAYASWYSLGDATSSATYSGLNGGDVTIDQKINPHDRLFDDGTHDIWFGSLGEVTVADGTATINVTSNEAYLYADAVALTDEPPEPPMILIDNGDPGYSTTGTWGNSDPNLYYWGGEIDWADGSTGQTATWSFSDLDNGIYDVHASWYSGGDATSSATYSGLNGGDVTIDQKINADDLTIYDGIRDVGFETLGQVTVVDGTATISVTSNEAYVYADAIALQIAGGSLAGDLNEDGFVGGDDLDIVRSFWGQNVTPGDLLQGDPSGDGFVGGDDLDIVRANWGQGTPPAPSAVPEPTALVLLSGAFLPWWFRRRGIR